MREPVITGVAGGVGTRTVAIALGVPAHPPGRHQPCDVLVCRATVHAVSLAERHVAATAGRPVLVVLDDGPVSRPARAKLRMLSAHVEAVLHLPWVPRWREVSNPYGEACRLAFQPSEQVPKHLQGYRKALGELVGRVRPLVSGPPPGLRAPPHPAHGPATHTGGPDAAYPIPTGGS